MEGGGNCVALLLTKEKGLQFVDSWVTPVLKLFLQMHCKYKKNSIRICIAIVHVFLTDILVAVMLLGRLVSHAHQIKLASVNV